MSKRNRGHTHIERPKKSHAASLFPLDALRCVRLFLLACGLMHGLREEKTPCAKPDGMESRLSRHGVQGDREARLPTNTLSVAGQRRRLLGKCARLLGTCQCQFAMERPMGAAAQGPLASRRPHCRERAERSLPRSLKRACLRACTDSSRVREGYGGTELGKKVTAGTAPARPDGVVPRAHRTASRS